MKKILLFILLLISFNAYGATFYVSDDGTDDSDCGDTNANACATMDYVFSSRNVAVGDDIYGKCGDSETLSTSSDAVQVTDGGTSGNIMVIGSYYMSGGSPVVGVNSEGRYKIDGNYIAPENWHTDLDGDGKSEFIYFGLIDIADLDYITVQDLRLSRSGTMGIDITDSSNIIVDNIWTDESYEEGIRIRSSDTVTVQDSLVEYSNRKVCQDSGCPQGKKPVAAGFGVSLSDAVTLKRSVFRNSYWYGGDFFNKNTNCVFEYNEMYGNGGTTSGGATSSQQLYLNYSNGVIVRYNLIYGGSYNDTSGITMRNELYGSDTTYAGAHIIHNNFIADVRECFFITERPAGVAPANNKIYNNYCIGRNDSLVGLRLGGGISSGHVVTNNVFDFSDPSNRNPGANVTADYNTWNVTPDSGLSGSNDLILSGIGTLFLSRSSWENIGDGDLSLSNFAISSDFPGLDEGTTITGYNTRVSTNSSLPDSVTLITTLVGSAWDIGAMEYGGQILNYPPSITAFTPDNQCVATDTNVSCTVTASDPDADSLSYSWTDNGVEFSTSEDPGNKQWTSEGTQVVRCTVNDGRGGTTYQESTITVSNSCSGGDSDTKTIGENTTDDYSGTVDGYIHAANTSTAYNGVQIKIEDPTTDDTTAKHGLVAFDLTNLSGVTVSDVQLCLYIESAAEKTVTLGVHASDNEFTEAATWTNYDGSTAWDNANSPEASELATLSVTTSTTGYQCINDGDFDTQVTADLGGYTYFVLVNDVASTSSIKITSSEGVNGQRPYLSVTYGETETTSTTDTWGENSTDDFTGVSEDSFINSASANTNYDTTSPMLVRGTDGRETYLRFDLRALDPDKDATAATLKLYCENAGDVTPAYNILVKESDDDAWTETGITYNCAQDDNNDGSCDTAWTGTRGQGAQKATTAFDGDEASSYQSWSHADLLAWVNTNAGGDFEVMLDSDTAQGASAEFTDSEGTDTQRPYLEITYPKAELLECEWVTPNGAYGESDTIVARCRWPAGAYWVDYDGDGNVEEAYLRTSATGATFDLTASESTFDGNDKSTSAEWHYFSGTVPASATTSGSELTISSFTVGSGAQFTGLTTLPGSPYRVEDQGSIYIDTSVIAWDGSDPVFLCNNAGTAISANTTIDDTTDQVCVCYKTDDGIYTDGGPNTAFVTTLNTNNSMTLEFYDIVGGGVLGPGNIIVTCDYPAPGERVTNDAEFALTSFARGSTTIKNQTGGEIASYDPGDTDLGPGAFTVHMKVPRHFKFCDSGCDISNFDDIVNGDVIHIYDWTGATLTPNANGETGLTIIFHDTVTSDLTMADATSIVVNSSTYVTGTRSGTATWEKWEGGMCGKVVCKNISDDSP